MTDSQRILVAGATGYIGGRLIPALLDAGHEVRGLARTPGKLAGRVFASDPQFTAVGGDVLERETLDEPLAGVDAAYYLVHSLGAGSDFRERDIDAATNFAQACAAAGVARIIYLSGLGGEGDELSEHLESRQATGDALREAGVPVTELRAAVIIGSGSASFEIMRDLTRRLPAMVAPKWVSSRCEPIAIADVVRYLVGCLGRAADGGRDLRHRRRHGADLPRDAACRGRGAAPPVPHGGRAGADAEALVVLAAPGDERRHAGRAAAHRRLAQRRA